MLKKIFTILAIVGVLLICVLAFVIPNNPNETTMALYNNWW